VVDCNKIDKEDYLLSMKRSPIKDIEIMYLLQNAFVDEINSHEIFMKGINISYYYEGYTEYDKRICKTKRTEIALFILQFDEYFCEIIRKDDVFVCLFLYPMNCNYLLKKFKAFYRQISYEILPESLVFYDEPVNFKQKIYSIHE